MRCVREREGKEKEEKEKKEQRVLFERLVSESTNVLTN